MIRRGGRVGGALPGAASGLFCSSADMERLSRFWHGGHAPPAPALQTAAPLRFRPWRIGSVAAGVLAARFPMLQAVCDAVTRRRSAFPGSGAAGVTSRRQKPAADLLPATGAGPAYGSAPGRGRLETWGTRPVPFATIMEDRRVRGAQRRLPEALLSPALRPDCPVCCAGVLAPAVLPSQLARRRGEADHALGGVLLAAVKHPVILVPVPVSVWNRINDPAATGLTGRADALAYEKPERGGAGSAHELVMDLLRSAVPA